MTRPLTLALVLIASSAVAGDAPRRDHAYHLTGGFAVGVASHTASSAYLDADPLLVAVVATFTVATGKEALDAAGFGTPEWADFGLSILGGLLGTACSWLALGLLTGEWR